MEYKYLSEDELNQLIWETEHRGMLQAPKRIQPAVWKEIAQQEAPLQKRKGQGIQLAVYSLKVSLAAAAAIFMLLGLGNLQESKWLFHMPEGQEQMEAEHPWEKEQEDLLHKKWTEVSEWFGTIFEAEANRN